MRPEIAALPLPDRLAPAVTADIEWMFSAIETADLIEAAASHPALAINPGPVPRGSWAGVAYKGGSERGVFAYAASVVDTDGCCQTGVAIWSDDADIDAELLRLPFSACSSACIRPPLLRYELLSNKVRQHGAESELSSPRLAF